MKRKTLAMSAIALLSLTACGADDGDAADEQAEVNEDQLAQLEAQEAEIESQQDQIAELEAEVESLEADLAESEEQASAADQDQADEDETEDENGNEDATSGDDTPTDTSGTTQIGETVEITGWGEGIDIEQAGTMTMNDIEVGFTNPECHDEPLNGQYLALNLTVDANSDTYEDITATQFNFYLIDDNGTMYRDEAQTMEAYSCASTSGSLEWVPPGTNHTGYIILDTDLTEGTVVYEGVGEDIRWEF